MTLIAINHRIADAKDDSSDPFAKKRLQMRNEFFDRCFQLGGAWLGGTDTYKRFMATAVPEFGTADAAYHLTPRKPLNEPGAGRELIVAGHEVMLAQWFRRALLRTDVELAMDYYGMKSNVKAFPIQMWQDILDAQPGKKHIRLPIDIWGMPGGQTTLAGVPIMSVEGMGGVASWLEPALCRYFVTMIQATKARLMQLATKQDAEFGLRAAPSEHDNLALLLARYVGGRGSLTSNDTAEFMYPELFKAIGTIGHELLSMGIDLDRSLEEVEFEIMDQVATNMSTASLLTDLIDSETIGIDNAIKVMLKHPDKPSIGTRVDSGNIAEQCVNQYFRMRAAGLSPRRIVFEDEVTPETARAVFAQFRDKTGLKPDMLFPGAGGYWWRNVHRDEISMGYKRSQTRGRPNCKFSNSPGKESIAGAVRVYAQGSTLVIADRSETIDGEPLYVQLVRQGRIVYNEWFEQQAERADATWGNYKKIVLSPLVAHYKMVLGEKRRNEIAAAKKRHAAAA